MARSKKQSKQSTTPTETLPRTRKALVEIALSMGLTKKQVAKLKRAKDVRAWIEDASETGSSLKQTADDLGAPSDGWSFAELTGLTKRGSNAKQVKAACAALHITVDSKKVTDYRKALAKHLESIQSAGVADTLTSVMGDLRTHGYYNHALVVELAIAAFDEMSTYLPDETEEETEEKIADMTSRAKRASGYLCKNNWAQVNDDPGHLTNDTVEIMWNGDGWSAATDGPTFDDITGKSLLKAMDEWIEQMEAEASEAEPEEVVVAFWRYVDDEDGAVFYCLHGGKRQTSTHPDLKAKLLRKAGFDWDGEEDNCWYCEKADWKAARETLSDTIPGLTFKRRKAQTAE